MAVIENGVYPKLRQFKRENSCYPLDFGELCSIKPMYIYIYMCVCLYMYTCVCMYLSMYIYMCIYLLTYAQIINQVVSGMHMQAHRDTNTATFSGPWDQGRSRSFAVPP